MLDDEEWAQRILDRTMESLERVATGDLPHIVYRGRKVKVLPSTLLRFHLKEGEVVNDDTWEALIAFRQEQIDKALDYIRAIRTRRQIN